MGWYRDGIKLYSHKVELIPLAGSNEEGKGECFRNMGCRRMARSLAWRQCPMHLHSLPLIYATTDYTRHTSRPGANHGDDLHHRPIRQVRQLDARARSTYNSR